ncbi:hypothetical protein H920_06596 [Fukomys damarensis]|uniref:Uncharacterized protein n=1 Tax=Fukomys damarensis TaxID=885580 RepID=A0A091DLP3_FUKDA|nr:hypothetical protein H920_06596 [Fukomys damarensis]
MKVRAVIRGEEKSSNNSAAGSHTGKQSASERTKSKLLEQVYWMEDKLEAVDVKEASRELYEKIILIKDQCIEKLQAEIKASQKQLKVHYTLQLLPIGSNGCNFQYQIRLFGVELLISLILAKYIHIPIESKRLLILSAHEGIVSENPIKVAQVSLFLSASAADLPDGCCEGLLPVEETDRKISLIMELSTQLSLQTERVIQLEAALEEKERRIQQLEAERSCHLSQEVKDPPKCLEDAPVFSASITPVGSNEDL